MGVEFSHLYQAILNQRLIAKAAGDKVTADTF